MESNQPNNSLPVFSIGKVIKEAEDRPKSQQRSLFDDPNALNVVMKQRKEMTAARESLRKQLIMEKRGIVSPTSKSFPSEENKDNSNCEEDMEVDEQTVKAKKSKRKRRDKDRSLQRQLQVYESILKSDLMMLNPQSFYVIQRPEGERCTVSSRSGKTISRNLQGHVIESFKSALPGGLPQAANVRKTYFDGTKTSILECIYNQPMDTYFIVDLLKWGSQNYFDVPLAARLFYLQEKYRMLLEADPTFSTRFKLITYFDMTAENFLHCYYGPILIKYFIGQSQTLDQEKIASEIGSPASLLFNQYKEVLEEYKVNYPQHQGRYEPKLLETSVQHAVSILQKVDFNQEGKLWFKDGLIIMHKESIYEQQLNPLVLQLKDPETSFYCMGPTNQDGFVECTLKLNNDRELETFEGQVLHLSIYNQSTQLQDLESGKNYLLKIKLGLQSVDGNILEEAHDITIISGTVKRISNRLEADNLTKILSGFFSANGQKAVAIHDIVETLLGKSQ